MFMSKLFKGLFSKELVVGVSVEVVDTTPVPERELVVTEPVISLGESLLILADWDYTSHTQFSRRYYHTLAHNKHEGLSIMWHDAWDTAPSGKGPLVNTRDIRVNWMTPDERKYINNILNQREKLVEDAAEIAAEQKRIEERKKFFVLVNQPG